jgi:hypothetical protein
MRNFKTLLAELYSEATCVISTSVEMTSQIFAKAYFYINFLIIVATGSIAVVSSIDGPATHTVLYVAL